MLNSIRLTEEERGRTRCLIVDSSHRVIASSDQRGVLTEVFHLNTNGQPRGSYVDQEGNLIGYALTPGYETYRGLGWYGVVSQSKAG